MTIPMSPGLIDAILIGVVVELLALGLALHRVAASRWILPLGLYLASGAFLVIALRVALSGPSEPWIALALLASLCAHVASLWSLYREIFVRSA